MRRAVLVAVLVGLPIAGCGARQQGAETSERLDAEDYGMLPGLKASPDKNLRDELARIIEEGGTPALLSQPAIADEDNVAAALAVLFSDSQIAAAVEQSEEIFPPGQFQLDPVRLQRAINFRKKYDAQRIQARAALRRPQCDFGVRFTAGLAASADWKFIDVVRICGRLEAFQAAESLADDRLAEAVDALESMLRLATCLGREKLVPARLEAAFLRTEAFGVLQAIVRDEQLEPTHLERLRQIVEDQLAAWPDDADAWIGDRALGLHAYEMVRAGRLGELLNEQEIEQFEQEEVFKELLAAAARSVDRDELYYLQAMRKIIDSCGQPYCARLPLFESIANDLDQKRSSPDFPIVATSVLLLPDVRKGHAIQAQDRANWEAWAVALALATRREMPPHRINPLTGKNYLYNKHDGMIEVTNFGSGKAGDNPSIALADLVGGD